jgi:hypothetical protein
VKLLRQPKNQRPVMLIESYLKEIKSLKPYILSIIVVIALSYSIYIYCSDDLIKFLGKEDSFFEWLTAIFFLFTSVLCFITFKRNKNIFVLGLAIMMFIGMGEEISWGQRIIGFKTPEELKSVNVQKETNIHNLEIFNDKYLNGVTKTGWQRILEINILFRVFSVCFLILLPIIVFHFKSRIEINKKFKLPVAPFTMGIFFLISWTIFYSIKYFLLPRGKSLGVYLSVGEVFEFTAAYVYFVVALYFHNTKDDSFLGRNLNQPAIVKKESDFTETKLSVVRA